MSRIQDLNDFYKILKKAECKIEGKKLLSNCHGRMQWIKKGVYFFFEDGELRDNNKDMRITRVGTHAVSKNSNSTLWQRLRSHKGRRNMNGNHRASVFRQLIGDSINNIENLNIISWNKSDISVEERNQEIELEKNVSEYIRKMPFIFVKEEDDAGPSIMRSFIEKNSIALLSNYNRPAIDSKSESWLGNYCSFKFVKVKKSGLWNQNFVERTNWDNDFLEKKIILLR